jgi:hypothetical protein
VRALEIAGFAGGGVLIPFGLRKLPYCNPCGLYMRTSKLASLTAGLAKKLTGDESPERQEQRRALAEQAQQGMDALFAAAAQGGEQLRAAAAQHAPKRSAFSPPSWVEVSLVHCRSLPRGPAGSSRGRAQRQTRGPYPAALGRALPRHGRRDARHRLSLGADGVGPCERAWPDPAIHVEM